MGNGWQGNTSLEGAHERSPSLTPLATNAWRPCPPCLQPPILQTQGVGAGRLGGREIIHAGVVRVVHEVVNRVEPLSERAGIVPDRTTGGRGAFRRGITYRVRRREITPLERMEESKPVPNLVHRGHALIVWRRRATRKRRIPHDHAIEERCAGIVPWERSPTQQPTMEEKWMVVWKSCSGLRFQESQRLRRR
jgi:hypothetical protein